MLSLVGGIPKTLNLKGIIDEYIKHRYDVVVRRTEFELRKAEEKEHILAGYLIALDNLDEVIKTIRSSKDAPTAKNKLIKNFDLSPKQAQAILDLRLHRLTGLERDKIKQEYKEIQELIKKLKELLGSEELIYEEIKKELRETSKKYKDERRTDISADESDIDIEDLIPEEENVISISHSGYIKRLPVTTYRKQGRGGRGVTGTNLKDEDFVELLFIASTHHYMMFFSNFGKVYRVKVHQLPTGSRTSKGKAIVNLLPFASGEEVAAIIAVKEYNDSHYLIMGTKKGLIKKTAIKAYDTSRKDGIIDININEGDELISVKKSNGSDEVIMVSRNGQAIRFSEMDCRPMGRASQGVKGMRLKGDDEVLSMIVIKELDADLFIITENGFGKRTALSQYNRQKRGGQGVRTLKITEKKGKATGAGILRDEYDLMIISENGVLIRIPAKSISRTGRSTQGVKVINLQEGNKVGSYSIMASE
jgi:DNA gyrase subunit A